MQQSMIIKHRDGTTAFVGPDAVALSRALTLRLAIDIYDKTRRQVTRGMGPTRLLALAAEYTGKHYKRGQYKQASEDLYVWANTMRAALPVQIEEEQ